MARNKIRNYQSKQNKYAILFLFPSLIGVCVFFVIPFLGTVYYAFTEGVSNLKFAGFHNFYDLLQNPVFLLATKNTFLFLGIAVPLLVLLATLLGVMLDKIPSLSYRIAILSPLILPSATLILGLDILLSDYISQIIPLNITDEGIAFPFVVGVYIIKNLGYMMILITSAIGGVPREYKEAFSLESKKEIKYIQCILMPTIQPMVFFVAILSIMNGLKISKELFLLYGNYPPQSVYMLQNFMNNNFFKLNYQRLSTAAILVIMAISILIGFYLKYTTKREAV